MKTASISLVRNEIDIILPFIRQLIQLFDRSYIIDNCSTDGTREALELAAQAHPSLSVFNYHYRAKYQGAIGRFFCKKAVAEGVDWVFLLDADEFLDVEGKDELQQKIQASSAAWLHLPWINLIPSEYGTYEKFPANQKYSWTGRISPYRKIAVSKLFLLKHPDFWFEEGNHSVRAHADAPEVPENMGPKLLHLPVRSIDRLRTKVENETILLSRKHNRFEGENKHATVLHACLDGRTISKALLNGIAADYGTTQPSMREVFPAEHHWPVRTLPGYLTGLDAEPPIRRTLAEARVRDLDLAWRPINFSKGSRVMAMLDDAEVVIRCQPITGRGNLVSARYEALADERESGESEDLLHLLPRGLEAALMAPQVRVFSAWSELVPVLGTLISVLKPRRYVELGVHNGMSFFAACQSVAESGIATECVAVDSWAGDPHAGHHSEDVFIAFRETLRARFPDQHYIRGYFDQAAELFSESSIDLLHIDGFHTYEAVKKDFETWLPKMSDIGVIIFHDTNVYYTDFGVWRFWKEISTHYPSFEFLHSHGLGILCVGERQSSLTGLLSSLKDRPELVVSLQAIYTRLGQFVIGSTADGRKPPQPPACSGADASLLAFQISSSDRQLLDEVLNSKYWRMTRPLRNLSNALRKLRGRRKKVWPKPSEM